MYFRPRLIAFDLDGTLAESKTRMSAAMGDLLAQLMKRIPVAVMSGAAFHQFEDQFLPSLPHDADLSQLYLFPTSAAACYVHRNSSWHPEYDHSFDAEEKKRIIATIKAAMEEVHFAQPEKLWGEQIEDRGAQITFSALGQLAPLEEKKQYDPTREKRKPLYEAIRRQLPEFSVALNAATSIDITRKGITKAYGIQKLVELTGVAIEEMIYVGDALEEGGNDAVVIESGIRTHAVFSPRETAAFIETVLENTHLP